MRDDIGHASYLQARTAAVVAANPHLAAKLTGKPAPVVAAPPPGIRVRPLFEKGRYIPHSLNELVAFVARQTDLHPDAIRGNGHSRRLVNARSCIAVLAQVHAVRLSAAAIDDGLSRGSGTCAWYRERHEDRMKLYPTYAELFARCRDTLAVSVRATTP